MGQPAKSKRKPRQLKPAAPRPDYGKIYYCTCGAPVSDTVFGRQQHYMRMPVCDPSEVKQNNNVEIKIVASHKSTAKGLP